MGMLMHRLIRTDCVDTAVQNPAIAVEPDALAQAVLPDVGHQALEVSLAENRC